MIDDWLLLADVAAVVFATCVYGFIAWRSWRSHQVSAAILDGSLAAIFAVAAVIGTRGLLSISNPPWVVRLVVLAIVFLPALRSLRLWMEARAFIAAAEGVLDE